MTLATSRKTPRTGRTHTAKDLAKVLSLMTLAYTAEDIADELPAPLDQVREMMAQVLADEEVRVVGRRREEVFADYTIRTRGMIRQLDELLVELRSSRQGNAAVGAVVAKHKLMDKVIERGQDFGLIERKPAQHAIIVAKLDDRELGEMVAAELTAMRGLLASGGTHFLEVKPAAPTVAAPVGAHTATIDVELEAGASAEPSGEPAPPAARSRKPAPRERPESAEPAFAPPAPGAAPARPAISALAPTRPLVIRRRVAVQ